VCVLKGFELDKKASHIAGFECLVDTGDDSEMRREFLPYAPNLIDGPKAPDSQDYMGKAACLSTPFMFESESSSFKVLNMQEVQKLALETESVVVLRFVRTPHLFTLSRQLSCLPILLSPFGHQNSVVVSTFIVAALSKDP
jgi:hypothetical protein